MRGNQMDSDLDQFAGAGGFSILCDGFTFLH